MTVSASRPNALQSMLRSGLKDQNQSVYQVWNNIFSVKEFNAFRAKHENDKGLSSYELLTRSMHESDDSFDTILAGCFHNRLKINAADPLFLKSNLVANWFTSIDLFVALSR